MMRMIRVLAERLMPYVPFRVIVTRKGERISLPANSFQEFAMQHGDELAVEPAYWAKLLHSTPDGSRHVPLRGSKSLRVPPKYELFEYKGFRIPAHLILLTGAGPETLEPIGKAHIASYEKFMGLSSKMTLLEIGCGIGRDAFQLIDILGSEGRYTGIDVTRDSIAWCQKNISARYPNFEFHHFDAKHELYNPLGTRTTLDFLLPAADCSVDRIMLGSIFTHLFEHEVVHYMKEIGRVLKPSGLAYATFFLYSDETIAAARRTDRTPFKLRFEHPYGDGCYVNDPDYPTGAVAYTDLAMRKMITSAGLSIHRPYLKGWWSGAYESADDGQEVAILSPQSAIKPVADSSDRVPT
jgi:SAM-dependent methyltransferase